MTELQIKAVFELFDASKMGKMPAVSNWCVKKTPTKNRITHHKEDMSFYIPLNTKEGSPE